MKPTLLQLAEKYHSDKLYWHSYIPMYEELFQDRDVKRLLEIGIGFKDLMQPFLPAGVEYVHGSSVKMWEEYFPEAEIFACDIREDALVNEGRIRSTLCDQSSPADLGKLLEWSGAGFDVVIDDGSHLYLHQFTTAGVLIPQMKKGSIYVIEDVWDNEEGRALAKAFGGELWNGEKGRDDNMVVIRR